jgi:hypothetical protein
MAEDRAPARCARVADGVARISGGHRHAHMRVCHTRRHARARARRAARRRAWSLIYTLWSPQVSRARVSRGGARGAVGLGARPCVWAVKNVVVSVYLSFVRCVSKWILINV